jgi:hypothetical protein
MAIRRLLVVLATVVVMLTSAGAALADNCYNASRSGGNLSTNPADFTAPLFKGRWLWLPSVGVPLPAWGFEVPANYQNGSADAWLLSQTKYCDAGGVGFFGSPRTQEHGIQSGCGNF